MTTRPTFKLSRLREIGWSKWDPIGVGELDYGWPADEYDAYLLQAAGQLWLGKSNDEVADYLVNIETEHMGLDGSFNTRLRALGVVTSLRRYVDTLRS